MGRIAMKGSDRTAVSGLVMITMISSLVLAGAAAVVVQQQVPPAIFVFGDGALDVGNNNYLPGGGEMGDPPRANHAYYGIDFPDSQATGRFSNGYNIADFIAKSMGFGMSPPAYLSLSNPISMDGFTGVNYASADAGIRNSTNAEMTIPLSKQVEYFAATRAQMGAKLGNHELRELLSKSFFLIGVGTMDLLPNCNFFLSFPPSDNQTEVQHLIAFYGAGITSLYDMGARRFGIVNVGLVGCGPSMSQSHSSGGCDDSMNKRAAEFNDALKPLLASLRSKLHGLRYSLADFYAFSNATFANPAAAGLVDTSSACCGGPCMPNTYFGAPCDNRAQYWFWDEGYTTEQAAKLAAAAFYDGPARFTVPVNFKGLMQKK